jgi:HD-GYP domain-containing protein (c-di-GMP phosphodiesterase class II)
MNLSEEDQYNLHYGAFLHDIGKITTPLEILEAPRKLTYDEMMIMKQHVAMSETILKDYIDPNILEIAIRHHEKLDGTGYHKGLSGEELTLPQRILAIADIISALTGKRSYKESFEKDKIFTILLNDANNGKISKEVVECVEVHFEQLMMNSEQKCAITLDIYKNLNSRLEYIYKQFQSLV